MPLPHLLLTPDADSYSQDEGAEVLAVSLGSGATLSRRDKVNAVRVVNARWSMSREAYRYFRAFYRTTLREGLLPFTCDLLSEDGGGAVAHQCNFIPGSVSMPSQNGLTYIQTATLEVRPLPVDHAANENIIELYEAYPNLDQNLFLALEHLVLIAMPATISA